MKKTDLTKRVIRIVITVGLLAAVVALVIAVFGDSIPTYIQLLRDGDEEAIEAYISAQNPWTGTLTIMLLSALQVVSIVFPGFAIQIASGVIYGWSRSFLMCYGGFLIGNIGVFLFARHMGRQIVGFAPKKKNKNNWIREKMKTTRPGFIVAFVNLLPILPNGIIPYLAAGSSISLPGYFVAIAISSLVQILFNCLAGGFLKNGQYLFMVLALSLQVGLLVLVTFKRKWIMSLIPGGRDVEEDEIDPRNEQAKNAEKTA